MYFKGWAIIHMLREMINDDTKFQAYLQALNKGFYHQTIYSSDLVQFSSEFFEQDLEPYFDQYLRHPAVPVLEYRLEKKKVIYRLIADVEHLEMPIKLVEPGLWIEATSEWQSMKIKNTSSFSTLTVDPNYLLEVRKAD